MEYERSDIECHQCGNLIYYVVCEWPPLFIMCSSCDAQLHLESHDEETDFCTFIDPHLAQED